MNKQLKVILSGCVLGVLIALAGFSFAVYAADTAETTNFPVAELGNCSDQTTCATYCDQPDNMDSCLAYGVKQGLVSEQEASIAQKAIVKIKANATPGGCKSRESCTNYCQNNITSLNSCIAFAEEIGVSDNEIGQAKKIAKALATGAGLPGNCSGKGSCESYCQDTNHIDECLIFAEAAEILPPAELAEAKKVAKFIKSGETPGACKTKADCQSYCDQDANFEECINFAQKAELVTPEEFDLAKKTGGKGPGECKSKQTCETYCNEPAHAEECANFALEKNILSDEEKDNVVNGVARIQTGLSSVPPELKGEVVSCLNDLMGGNLAGVLAGTQKLTQNQGDQVGSCFTKAAAAGAGAAGGGGSGGAPTGSNLNSTDLEKAPADVQAKINQAIQQRQQEEIRKNTPTNIPTPPPTTGGAIPAPTPGQPPIVIPTPPAPPPTTGGTIPAPNPGQPPTAIPTGPDCSAFASVPSCSMVGGGQALIFCKKCFPNK